MPLLLASKVAIASLSLALAAKSHTYLLFAFSIKNQFLIF